MESKYEPSEQEKELPDCPFPLFSELPELNDTDLKWKVPLELFLRHDGYKINIEGEEYTLSIYTSPKDSLELKTSTFKWNCPDAIHYSGRLTLPNILIMKEVDTTYLGYEMPNFLSEVLLHRVLTEEEIRKDSRRYEGYEAGDITPKFCTIEDIVARARFVANIYFPDFKLIVKAPPSPKERTDSNIEIFK